MCKPESPPGRVTVSFFEKKRQPFIHPISYFSDIFSYFRN
ncbi:MAG: DUF3667 domain-containing protein [Eubacterium sp.]|nr:DUF3667 domain-containing protein [Eubacterium sp.]